MLCVKKRIFSFTSIVALLICIFALTGCDTCDHHSTTLVSNTATCENAGIATYKCTDCGKTVEKASEPTGHSYSIISDTATCTEKGERTYKCSKCGITKTETSATKSHAIVGCKCSECGELDFGYKEVTCVYDYRGVYEIGMGGTRTFYGSYSAFNLEITKDSTTARFVGVSIAKVEIIVSCYLYSEDNVLLGKSEENVRACGAPTYNIKLSRAIKDNEILYIKIHDTLA